MKRKIGALWKKARHMVRYYAKLNIPVYASSASFFMVLSVFPLLVLLFSLLRYTGLEVENLTEILHGIVPTALMPSAQKLIFNAYNSTTGMTISISALVALWSASRGIHGVRTGLNAIYGVEENRNYFYTRGVSMVYTVLFLVVLVLTLVLYVFDTSIVQWEPLQESRLIYFLENVVDLRYFLLLIVQTVLFTAMFMVLPNRHNKLMDSFPGAVFASIGWLVFSDLYSIYIENFASLTSVYGSVYAVALSMLWLYCCVSIVFYGGALNHWLMDSKTEG